MQFHPEATELIADSWGQAAEPPPTAGQAARLRAGWAGAAERTAADAAALFSAWLDGGLAAGLGSGAVGKGRITSRP